MRKNILAVAVLLMILLLSNIANASEYDTNGFGIDGSYQPAEMNEDGYYEISNAGQLYWFAQEVNSGNIMLNGLLTEDIVVNTGDLSGYDGASSNDWRVWTPIATDYYGYQGDFDGQNHTINGLYVNEDSQDYVGLFGCAWGGSIKNLTIDNSYLYGAVNVGGICAYNSSLIENCHIGSRVTIGAYSKEANAVGGICAVNENIISKCSNKGKIYGQSEDFGWVGGICGESYKFDDYCYGLIIDCFNEGYVEGRKQGNNFNTYIAAGICGYNTGDIVRCYNAGEIYSFGESSVFSGGICGQQEFDSIVSSCFNTGKVRTESDYHDESTGGISAFLGEGSTISNCYNIGEVLGNSSRGNIAGIIYNHEASKVTNNYYDLNLCAVGGADGIDIIGKAEGKTTEQFKSGEVCYLLNGNQQEIVYKQILGEDTYPSFEGGIVYLNNGEYTNEMPHEHIVVIDEAVEETCTATGLTAGSHCDVCGEVIVAQKIIPKVKHNFVDGFCDVCGKQEGTGYALSATVTSWNNKDDLTYLLYDGAMSDEDIAADLKGAVPSLYLTSTDEKGSITANNALPGAIRYEQDFRFEQVDDGDYKLAITKAGKYVPKIMKITIAGNDYDVNQELFAGGEIKLWLYGDVTNDGRVNSSDALQIQRYYAGKTSQFDSGSAWDKKDRENAADITFDGRINSSDALQIQRFYAGKTSAFDKLK